MRWKWLWLGRDTADELEEAKRRLEEIHKDDRRVDALDRRVQRIRRENNLAPAIIRALGVRR